MEGIFSSIYFRWNQGEYWKVLFKRKDLRNTENNGLSRISQKLELPNQRTLPIPGEGDSHNMEIF